MNLTYVVSNKAFKIVLCLFAKLTISGQERVPQVGPIIVASNHLSIIDPAIVAQAIPRRVRFLAKNSLFKNLFVRKFLTAYGAHAISRSGHDNNAIRWSIDTLSNNEIVGIFPEGTRHRNGMHIGLNGCALLALQTGAPVIPVGITGTENLDNLWHLVFPTGKIHIAVGEPFVSDNLNSSPTKSELESTTRMIMHRIANTLPDAYQGIYRESDSECLT
jgi:1-acyl-sn-glycerol-3-phosphate acyltransferase